MSKRYTGVRHIEGNIYEINFRPYKKAKRVFKRIQADSMQKAYTVRAEEISQHLKRTNVLPIEAERQKANFETLRDVIINDLNADNKSRKTINRFKLSLKTFIEFLNKKHSYIDHIGKLRGAVFSDYKDYIVLELGRQNGWRAELTIIKSIFSRLHKRGYCSKELLDELSTLKRPPKREKYYKDISTTDVKKLLAFIEKNNPSMYGIIYFIYRLGWRIEETTYVRRADIKWNGLRPVEILIRAETTKIKKTRILDTFDDELIKVIKRYAFNRRKTEWLFANRNNNRFHPKHIRGYLKRVSNDILGYAITPHDFRHRFCTVMGRSDMSIKDVMAISGIKDINVLLTYYTHSTQVGKEKVLETSRTF